MPIRFSCTTWFTRSIFFCIFLKSGKPNLSTSATITIITGRRKTSISDTRQLIENAKNADTIRSAGARTRIRRIISRVFCSAVTSFVRRVVSDEVENVSIFLKEKPLIFSNISRLSL